MQSPQPALKYEVQVTDQGRIEIPVPFPAGSRVLVFVLEQTDEGLLDLAAAAQSSTDFWNNPVDDEEWNNA
jgi:hypothetical protein